MGPSTTRCPREDSSRPRFRVRLVWSPRASASAFSCSHDRKRISRMRRAGGGQESQSRVRLVWSPSASVPAFYCSKF